MANLAQVVNVLQAVVVTDGARMWHTPTYHAFRLHAVHQGATALQLEVSAADSLPDGMPVVSAAASRSADGMAVTVINRHRHADAEVCIELGAAVGEACADVLTAERPGGDEYRGRARSGDVAALGGWVAGANGVSPRATAAFDGDAAGAPTRLE